MIPRIRSNRLRHGPGIALILALPMPAPAQAQEKDAWNGIKVVTKLLPGRSGAKGDKIVETGGDGSGSTP